MERTVPKKGRNLLPKGSFKIQFKREKRKRMTQKTSEESMKPEWAKMAKQ